MKDNIYIKALEVGYEHSITGISFNDIVNKLGIKESLNDEAFKANFITWFYTNFYHRLAEQRIIMNSATGGRLSQDGIDFNINKLDEFNSQKSFIKGDSTQKYIDYLELKESRESSQTAKKISYISIGIAILSILLSPFISRVIPEDPKQVIVTENRDKIDNEVILEKLTKIDSTINSAITKLSLIANKKVEVTAKK
jgi:hypothetical protein